jgi:hypothetical protein
MRWGTVDALLESAKKYAAIEEDLAVKSYKDHVYWHHKVVADLIKAMAEVIKEHLHGEAVDKEGHKEAWGSPSDIGGSNRSKNTSQEAG